MYLQFKYVGNPMYLHFKYIGNPMYLHFKYVGNSMYEVLAVAHNKISSRNTTNNPNKDCM